MNVKVSPSLLSGSVEAPGSKSIAIRMVAGALCARGTSALHHYPQSDDTLQALRIAESLGAAVARSGDVVSLTAPQQFSGARIDCGESGLASRLFPFLAALTETEYEVTGRGSLLQRTALPLTDTLKALKVSVLSGMDKLPVRFRGPLKAGEIHADGQFSSQALTGLLFALPLAADDSTLTVDSPVSTPYLQMTVDVLAQFGVQLHHEHFRRFTIPGRQSYQPVHTAITGDWSGAAFLMVAAAVCGETPIRITGLSDFPQQADSRICGVLQQCGVNVLREGNDFTVFPSQGRIEAFEVDATDCPDLVPPLTALAAFARGISVVYGAGRLRHKESNRARVLAEEFAKANVRILLRGDEMKIYPGPIRPCQFNAHNDHRIAMAGALLGLAGANITITGAQCVSKSFPGFWEQLSKAGAKIS
jgi:3-phosphoshikimate 1-carboxyvinyltransferase